MNTRCDFKALWLTAALACALSTRASAQPITNGGFESGLAGWTRADQIGSDGTFFVQSGTTSPLNGFPVPAPPEGLQAAMTDSGAGGAHVLYQDFVVPTNILGGSISFDLFLNNGADNFYTPASLDWAATNQNGRLNLNQQARVDILTASSDPFSVAAGDVLQNLFQTHPGDPLVSGYDTVPTDISALLLAHAGETLRLRFAEVDNVSFFNFGVDNVSLSVQAVPEPSSLWMAGALILACGGPLGLARVRRRA
jgi:hypothetical protein